MDRSPIVVSAPPGGPFKRLHEALMPDYNGKTTAYWWAVVVLGGLALGHAIWALAAMPGDVVVQVVGGTALAIVAGFFPVRIPGSKNSFVAGEIFIFLLLLMHGPAAAMLAAAGESFIGSYRSSKRWTSRIFSPAAASIAMFLAGLLLTSLFGFMGKLSLDAPGLLLVAATLVSLSNFAVNTLLVTVVFTLKFDKRFEFREFVSSFGTIGIAFGGSALIAALLFLTVQNSGLGVLLGALPVIGMLLTTVHYFLRQQEAVDSARKSRIEAAEREAAQSARHLEALRESEQRFHSAFTHASIGMALVTFEGRVLQANTALCALLGVADGAALVDAPFGDHLLDADVPAMQQELERVRSQQASTVSLEVRARHRAGGEIWVAVHCAYFSEPGTAAPCLILQVQDIHARRQAESQLNRIAFHDSLTGLANRHHFHTLLGQALAATRDDPGRHFGLMFFDFDRFKLINDSMGHSAGDEFLVQVSRRLQQHVRPGDTVARLGGDEFAVLVRNVENEQVTTALADRLQAVLKEPMNIAGVNVSTSASIGITFSRMGYEKPEDLLRDADIAMYRAKAAGKARYAVFDAELHTELSSRVRMEAELRQALADGALHVDYQPLYKLSSFEVQGFEALARWTHPTLGEVSPAVFIPIAEESGLIVELTDMVLARACRQLALWQDRDPSMRELKMQVNLSGNDVAHPELARRIERAVRDAGISASRLTLELTENILMQRVEGAMSTLEALRRLGVGLAIDDFGTGYSSLSYLSSLPIDSLKIDRSFVKGIREGSKDSEIVRAIVSLGASLGKTVVAEGIESSSQFAQLRELGCEHGQGFHLSRPLAPVDVDKLLDGIVLEHRLGVDRLASAGIVAPLWH